MVTVVSEVYEHLHGCIDGDYCEVQAVLSEQWEALSLDHNSDAPHFVTGLIALHSALQDGYKEWSRWAAVAELSTNDRVEDYLTVHVSSIYEISRVIAVANDCRSANEVLTDVVQKHREIGYIEEFEYLINNLSKVIANYLSEDWEGVFYDK